MLKDGTCEDVTMGLEATEKTEEKIQGFYSSFMEWILDNHISIGTVIGVMMLITWNFGGLKQRFASIIVSLDKGVGYMDKEKCSIFKSLSTVVSKDPYLSKENSIRLLEIGAGTGSNLPYYPNGTHLTVVDNNPCYKDYFASHQKKYPNIHSIEYHTERGEDMRVIPDNSIDVVVITLVLSMINDVDPIITEIKRILVPGGKFYFLEHIAEFDLEKYRVRRILQDVFTYYIPVHPFFFDGCHLDRDPLPNIEKAGFSKVEAEHCYAELPNISYYLQQPILKGIATK